MASTALQFTLPDEFQHELANSLSTEAKVILTNLAQQDYYPRWMNTVAAADYCGVSRTTLLDWVKNDGLKFVKVHRVKRFGREELDEFMQRHIV